MKRFIFGILIISLVIFGCGKKEAKEPVEPDMELTETTETQGKEIYQPVVLPEEATQTVVIEEQTVENVTTDVPFVKPALKEVQQALKNAGFDITVDGKKGPKTTQAIKDFQSRNSLKIDGKVGPQTWLKLQPYLKSQVQE